ncbi:MAG TPA: hypothetical protein DCR46_02340, partial [Cytophagales bacterium]|nr:hypothetical protein [Cytophagales bacterium]
KAKLIIGVLGAQIDGDKLAGYDKAGAVLGMGMELKLGEKFSIQPEVLYAQKGARSSNKSPYFGIVRLSYIDLNGVLNFYLKDNIVLQGGIYYGLLFRAKADAGLGFVDALNLYNKTDLGYLAGVEYRFTPKTSANLRFGYSLANISPIIPQYNNIISFTLRVQLAD